ncbi:hypothetical protein [Leptospira noguchii]|uniref:Uncharacterized protein n=1 Tax=Leptospira noguchii serovar Panama str. CZ214 TaxID=1001595 RepID=T0GVC0_9LEPT|nr:hypothetical protein [Leptospira noguchii]EQA72872.1 hypothetical protein LEP1GSC059_3323 [Leptospira noguchii serovar Panama str. CZ214]
MLEFHEQDVPKLGLFREKLFNIEYFIDEIDSNALVRISKKMSSKMTNKEKSYLIKFFKNGPAKNYRIFEKTMRFVDHFKKDFKHEIGEALMNHLYSIYSESVNRKTVLSLMDAKSEFINNFENFLKNNDEDTSVKLAILDYLYYGKIDLEQFMRFQNPISFDEFDIALNIISRAYHSNETDMRDSILSLLKLSEREEIKKYRLVTLTDAYRMSFLVIHRYDLKLSIGQLEKGFRRVFYQFVNDKTQIEDYLERIQIYFSTDKTIETITKIFVTLIEEYTETKVREKINQFRQEFKRGNYSKCAELIERNPKFYEETRNIVLEMLKPNYDSNLQKLFDLYTQTFKVNIANELNFLPSPEGIQDKIIRNRYNQYLDALRNI